MTASGPDVSLEATAKEIKLGQTAEDQKQYWKFIHLGNGKYRLTNPGAGENRTLSGRNGSLMMDTTADSDTQYWTLSCKAKNPEKAREYNNRWAVNNPEKVREARYKWKKQDRKKNLEKYRAAQREAYKREKARDPERVLERSRISSYRWRKINREKYLSQRRIQNKNRRKDPNYRLRENMSVLVRQSLRRKDIKKVYRLEEILDYSPDELRRHLEPFEYETWRE